MIEIKSLYKIYNENKKNCVTAIHDMNLRLPSKGIVMITGKSGSGKTTLLNILGTMDQPTEGEIIVDGVSMNNFTSKQYENYRNSYVGFAFQEYNLMNELSVSENVRLVLELQGTRNIEEEIDRVLSLVGLEELKDKKIAELSGGQKQRVTIARAIVKNCSMILADEPTGALDYATGTQVMDALKYISNEKLVLVVTHDKNMAHTYGDRIIEMEAGKIIADSDGEMEIDSERAFELRESKASLASAWQFAVNGMKKKKMRCTVLILLSVVAFLFLGISDVISNYDRIKVLVNSIYDNDKTIVTLKKGKKMSDDETEEWYDDHYKLSEADIEELNSSTDGTYKGIYTIPFETLNIENNYGDTSFYDEKYGQYIAELSGFVEFDEADLADYGFALYAGRMPDGDSDEIAISKYLYESFCLASYAGYTGPEVELRKNEKFLESLSWDEFRAKSSEYFSKKEIWKIEDPTYDIEKIINPDDLIGKSIFLGRRNYTITGIIDTHFDGSRYADLTAADAQNKKDISRFRLSKAIDEEKKYGAIGWAFVGKGKVKEIASRYPSVVTVDGMNLTFQNDYISITSDTIARLSDVDQGEIKWNDEEKDTLKQREIVVSRQMFDATETFLEDGTIRVDVSDEPYNKKRQDIKLTVSYEDGRPDLVQNKFEVAGRVTGEKKMIDDLGEAYNLSNTVILPDELFETVSAGRQGTYNYAVLPVLTKEKEMEQLINVLGEYKEDTRYCVTGAIAEELESLDTALNSFASIAKYVSILFLVLETVIFFNFVSMSIFNKKSDIGIMQAVGFRKKDIFIIYLLESLSISVINILIASPLVFLISLIGNGVIKEKFGIALSVLQFSWKQVLLIMVTGFGIAFVTSILSVVRIAKANPAELMRS